MLRLRIAIDPSGENSASADVQLQKLGRKNAFTFLDVDRPSPRSSLQEKRFNRRQKRTDVPF
ncbi:hypothetical protein APY04_1289 [Hyphomicrobium sulfonivorans]|uniref:Uncharacterized protein n=1 Tax=Hyphomicrobium sulfonivorans TaxID=121290 RepID=A0A120CWX2_HYPSL|nr:hypothetical protein APY04_1289 [Hyphomicrobium sulfonivorans]